VHRTARSAAPRRRRQCRVLPLSGHSTADVCGRNFLAFLHPGDHSTARRQFGRLAAGLADRFDQHVLIRSGETPGRPARITGFAVHDRTCHLAGVVVLLRPDTANPGLLLSDLDACILERAAAGLSTAQLALELYLSRQGVEYRIGRMLRLLDVPNRTALISKAYAMGILDVDTWPPRVDSGYIRRTA